MKKKNLILFAAATLGLTSATMAQVPSYVSTNGLIGWYPFNSNANDESGNNINGVINGATLTTDRNSALNSAYNFDGVNDYIECGNSSFIQLDSFTISTWFNFNGHVNYEGNAIFSTEGYQPTGKGFVMGLSEFTGQKLDFIYRQTTTAGQVETPVAPQINVWHHAVVTYVYANGTGEVKLYVNNLLESSSTLNEPISYIQAGSFKIGTNIDLGLQRYFKGQIDDLGLWNRVLSECEISDLYNSQLGSLNTSATQTQTALDSYTWPINSQTYTQSGTYTAVIPNAAGCDSTITLDLSLDFTGINEFSEDNLFTVFPNPAQSAINIKADNKLIGDVYTIYDNTGRVVLTGKLTSNNTTIELGNLSGGIYMFSVGENMKQTFKVIKE